MDEEKHFKRMCCLICKIVHKNQSQKLMPVSIGVSKCLHGQNDAMQRECFDGIGY